ncbi:MAG: prolyl oligopeptidase family serine peptidase [Myxococcota bacterium]
MIWLVVGFLACGKSVPVYGVEPTAPSAATVTFGFAPEAGPVARTRMVRSIIEAPGPVRGTVVSWNEQVQAERDGAGFRLRIQREAPEVQSVGLPNGDQMQAALFQHRLLPRDQTMRISGGGAFERLTFKDVEATLQGVRDDLSGAVLEGEQADDVLAAFHGMVTSENLNALANNEWSLGSGFFAGNPTLEFGETYALKSASPLPLMGPQPVSSNVNFVVLRPVACHAEASSFDCVELVVYTELDGEAVAERISALMATAGPGPKIESIESLERAEVIINPATLSIWRSVKERTVQMRIGDEDIRRRFVTVDERIHEGRASSRPSTSLVDARSQRTTNVTPSPSASPPATPEAPFALVQYPSPVGSLAAYVTEDPQDGKRHPAIVWITGGDCNTISDVWTPQPRENDQSAAAYRERGMVILFPSLRGGNDNPGKREGFLGEVDDVLAATTFLASLPYVDPDRIYLGGHSTGGTLALLVAASTDRYRGVFAFGPVGTPLGYGGEFTYADMSDPWERRLREPRNWIHAITSPTWIFEGRDGNIDALWSLKTWAGEAPITFVELPGDHFDGLAPTNEGLAAAILDGTIGPAPTGATP